MKHESYCISKVPFTQENENYYGGRLPVPSMLHHMEICLTVMTSNI